MRLLLQAAAHGGGRCRGDRTSRAHRRTDHDDHDCLQLHRRHHFGSYTHVTYTYRTTRNESILIFVHDYNFYGLCTSLAVSEIAKMGMP